MYNDGMRILIISANTESFPEPTFPIGAVYVANALQNSGARVRIFDMRRHTSESMLKKELAAFHPDRVGISLRNADNAAYPFTRFYLPSYHSMVKLLRASCDAPIILGGSAFSLFPAEVALYLGVDTGIRGEGEASMDTFLNPAHEIITSNALPDLDNVSFPHNIDKIFPDFHKYRTIGIQTARGCPNHCIYCTYPRLEGSIRRQRSPDMVAAEIARLYRDFKFKNFFMVDSIFNADENHMIAVAKKMTALNLPI